MKTAKSFNSFNNDTYTDVKKHITPSKRQIIMAGYVGKNKKVLDLGCGSGQFVKFLNKRNNQAEGVEISKKVAKIGQGQGLKIKITDLHHTFPYNKDTFHAVTAGEIIEHIYDTDFFLKEIKRILKPNGFLILSTPNIATIGRRLMLLFGINPLIETSLTQGSGHIRYFTEISLKELLEKHGFKIINFTSDTINFTNSGQFQSQFLAKIFPNFGARLIVKAINIK